MAEIGHVLVGLIRPAAAELVGPLLVELVGPLLVELIRPAAAERVGPLLAKLVGPLLVELIRPVAAELVRPLRAGIGPDGRRCRCGPRHGHDPAGQPAAAASGRPGTDREWSNPTVRRLAHSRIFIMFYRDLS
ncbi:hypothetical protein ACQEVC_16690 [Plantactinospora sp. CA-294935]|uniref:hypothetical protein n=1 Tax=Plantactinospora sp. CA-294935 TaxID=3240012 RepID=UPI003D8FED2D